LSALLNADPKKRPSAYAALAHAYLNDSENSKISDYSNTLKKRGLSPRKLNESPVNFSKFKNQGLLGIGSHKNLDKSDKGSLSPGINSAKLKIYKNSKGESTRSDSDENSFGT
jgi:hypothetical protein